jgi:hypothetical protein
MQTIPIPAPRMDGRTSSVTSMGPGMLLIETLVIILSCASDMEEAYTKSLTTSAKWQRH